MRRPQRQRLAGIVLTLLGYFFVFGQSVAHSYAHLDLAHHGGHVEAEHAHDTDDDHHVGATISDLDEPDGHFHASVDDGVMARATLPILAIVRPVQGVEFDSPPRRTQPPTSTEPVPRRSLHTTAPPSLRAPPVS